MSMIEFDEYKVKLNTIRPKLDDLALSLNIESAKEDLDRLHAQIESDGFWDNQELSQKVMKQTRQLEDKVERYGKMCTTWDDLMTICEMALEENDESMLEELKDGYHKLEEQMETARLETLLSGEYDSLNAIVSFQAGAGGTEAQDWAQMLYRMYTHWAESHGFTYKILDYLDGDEAGIKSASIMVEGVNAYGLLKSENGVHRLVRVSPFDANARRQTSFAAVEVIPEITDDSKDVDIRPEDIEMQVYRSSGAGGQHINKTSSAVRLIHKPTGIVVSCQTQRDQFQNRETCMRMLRSKLIEIKEREHLDKISDIKGAQLKIERVRQLFDVTMVEYNAKAGLVEKAKMYRNCAISIGGEVAAEARVAIAQAANDLLTIQGVDASFVAVQVGTGVNVSARSLGAVNVQVIMESLGGGGHQTMAAAQLKHITPEAARSRIEGAIDKYYASQKKGGAEGK